MKDLRGKVAVVTGAASGIGRAMAQRLAGEGMKLVLGDIEEGELKALERELCGVGHEVASRRTDVSRAEDVEALKDLAVREFGAVHLLCNNAGVGIGGLLWEHSVEDWQWLISVNLMGVVHGIRSFVPLMLQQGEEAHVVNTASAAGLDARPYLGMYSATKYAVVAMSEALQQELAQRGARIGVSVLCPALVRTRIGESERNRPPSLQSEAAGERPPDVQAFDQAFRAALAQGTPPERVAEVVVDAVREARLYIIIHEETEVRVRARFERMLKDAVQAVA